MSTAHAANVLIVAGTNGLAQTAANVIAADLLGNTITIVNTALPGDILTPGYTQIYDVRYDNSPALSVGEQAQYLAYLQAAPGNT
ncbi:MAG TPA: hypothetical protein VNH18_24915, partial [Bryobacteraceae bacterium]|nr:hypothetical protein [Bryobacteraceae bacterium]